MKKLINKIKSFFKKIWNYLKRFGKWVASLFGCGYEEPEPIPTPPKFPPPSKNPFINFPKGSIGVDISHHNGTVDLKTLVKNVKFIYMKATEGTGFVSSTYLSRSRELQNLKFPWGAYHYYKINKDPIRQAEHFCAHLRTDSGLPPVLDIEAINNERYQFPKDTENLLKFLDFVENFTSQVPMIYSNYYFLRDKIQPDKRFEKYPLWIAWYTNDFNRVRVPKPWDRITLWQYTDRALIDGVKGSVDANKVI